MTRAAISELLMKTNRLPGWVFGFGFLILLDIGLRIWIWSENSAYRASTKRVVVVPFHTNGMDSVGIIDTKTGKPLLLASDYGRDGKPGAVNYYFQGKDVFDIILKDGRLPRYSVSFYGPDKSQTWWLDRGGAGSFTERVFYDTNGVPSGHETWYDDAWHTVERRNEKYGVIVNGQWRPLVFDTNGLWTPMNNHQ